MVRYVLTKKKGGPALLVFKSKAKGKEFLKNVRKTKPKAKFKLTKILVKKDK